MPLVVAAGAVQNGATVSKGDAVGGEGVRKRMGLWGGL
jgi:hypothetical protein